jgi:hypothetical protein
MSIQASFTLRGRGLDAHGQVVFDRQPIDGLEVLVEVM